MVKVIDSFIFGLPSDLDILEIRFNELYDVVDYFVLVESEETHSGFPKAKVFLDNIHRFEPFLNKVKYVLSDLQGLIGSAKYREDKQRGDIILGLRELELEDSDLILISDLDEIPNSNIVASLAEAKYNHPVAFNQWFFAYYLNLRGINKDWVGTVMSPYHLVKEYGTQFFRNGKDFYPRVDGRSGWHFSWTGGAASVLKKLQAFSHQENPYKNYPLERLQKIFNDRVVQNKQFDFANDSTPLEVVSIDDSFPIFIQANLDKFATLIINE